MTADAPSRTALAFERQKHVSLADLSRIGGDPANLGRAARGRSSEKIPERGRDTIQCPESSAHA
jgi:hypothetical protein